jgi:hypothetical protein
MRLVANHNFKTFLSDDPCRHKLADLLVRWAGYFCFKCPAWLVVVIALVQSNRGRISSQSLAQLGLESAPTTLCRPRDMAMH